MITALPSAQFSFRSILNMFSFPSTSNSVCNLVWHPLPCLIGKIPFLRITKYKLQFLCFVFLKFSTLILSPWKVEGRSIFTLYAKLTVFYLFHYDFFFFSISAILPGCPINSVFKWIVYIYCNFCATHFYQTMLVFVCLRQVADMNFNWTSNDES